MTKSKNVFAQLFTARRQDEARTTRFRSDPTVVLDEHGLDVLGDLDVKEVENADDCKHSPCRPRPLGTWTCRMTSEAAWPGNRVLGLAALPTDAHSLTGLPTGVSAGSGRDPAVASRAPKGGRGRTRSNPRGQTEGPRELQRHRIDPVNGGGPI